MSSANRSRAACDFCRVRKLRCDNGIPQCSSCRSRGLDCHTAARVARPRPSKAAIDTLKRENERLRRLLDPNGTGSSALGRLDCEDDAYDDEGEGSIDGTESSPTTTQKSTRSHRSKPSSTAFTRDGLRPGSAHSVANTDPRAPVTDAAPKATQQTPYYGPTSAHFDAEDSVPPPEVEPSTPHKGTWRGTLVAAAAIERQKEHLHYVSNRLDCDGWDPELVMHLLNIHWNRQHHNLSLIYRPLFMRDMACGGPYFSRLLLNAIMFAASKFSPRKDIRSDPDNPSTAGWQYRQRVRVLLGEALDQSAIPTIQALITVASSLFAIGEARSTSWLYSGVAFRMLVDLGLHRDSEHLVRKDKLTIEELEVRRRVFWGAFIFDKLHSMYLGRPATLQETEASVPIEFFDDYEELEAWVPVEQGNTIDEDYTMPKHGRTTTYSVSAYIAHCKLSVLLARILASVYTNATFVEQSVNQARADMYLVHLDDIDRGLQEWMLTLPDCVRYEPWLHPDPAARSAIPTPSTLSVTLMYHLLIILLHRPFVTQGQLYDTRVAEQSLRTCTVTAVKLACIIQHYCVAFTIRRAPYFVAYCAYVACTVLTRVACRVTGTGPHTDDLKHWLHMLLEILRRSERTNAGVKRANSVLATLLKRNHLDTEMFLPLSRIEEDFVSPPTDISPVFSPVDLTAILESFAMSYATMRPSHPPNVAANIAPQFDPSATMGNFATQPVIRSGVQAAPFTEPDFFHDSIFGFHSGIDPFGEWPTFPNSQGNMFR